MDIYVLILPLLIGWILDKLLGDPVGLPHPVVGFGKLISFCEKRWNCGTHRMLKGGVAAIMLILLVYAGSVLVLHYLFVLNRWLGIILSAVLVFLFSNLIICSFNPFKTSNWSVICFSIFSFLLTFAVLFAFAFFRFFHDRMFWPL